MSALLFLAQTLRIAIPYLFAASGGAIAERAGVVSLTLEGFMLGGAFGAVMGAFYTGSAWLGMLCGIAAGLLLGSVHAVASMYAITRAGETGIPRYHAAELLAALDQPGRFAARGIWVEHRGRERVLGQQRRQTALRVAGIESDAPIGDEVLWPLAVVFFQNRDAGRVRPNAF